MKNTTNFLKDAEYLVKDLSRELDRPTLELNYILILLEELYNVVHNKCADEIYWNQMDSVWGELPKFVDKPALIVYNTKDITNLKYGLFVYYGRIYNNLYDDSYFLTVDNIIKMYNYIISYINDPSNLSIKLFTSYLK